MNPGVDHLRVDVHAQHRDGENAETITDDCYWNDSERQQRTVHFGLKEQVRTDEAGDEEHQRRTDPATFLSDFDRDAGQFEKQPVAQNGCLGNAEHYRCSFGRRVLKESFYAMRDDHGKWDHENQKGQGKGKGPRPSGAEDPGRA